MTLLRLLALSILAPVITTSTLSPINTISTVSPTSPARLSSLTKRQTPLFQNETGLVGHVSVQNCCQNFMNFWLASEYWTLFSCM